MKEREEGEDKSIFVFGKYFLIVLAIIIIAATGILVVYKNDLLGLSSMSVFSFPNPGIEDSFVLEEAEKMSTSSHADWWLNSGGIMNISKNGFSTNLGKLDKNSKWRKLYNKNNARDTDDGYYPQNIFRLVLKSKWKNFTQEVYFSVEKTNLSDSEYRNESNGVLLFNRYQDGDNLYYTGLRVDGHAVIKKKIDEKYYTLKEKKVLTEKDKYDRNDSPNLIPENTWIGIKSEVRSVGGDTVSIKLFVDKEGKGDWKMVLETQDKDSDYGKNPIMDKGYGGIRTDFMDVKFRDYRMEEK